MRALLVMLAACGSAAPAATEPTPAAPAIENVAVSDGEERLAVTGIEPEHADAMGGTYMRIRGTGFLADGPREAKIYFGSRQGTLVRFASDSEMIVEAPGGKTGERVDVLILFTPGGELKLPSSVIYVDKN